MLDERVEALRSVATDEDEYSGWVNLARGGLAVIEELQAASEALAVALEAAISVPIPTAETGLDATPYFQARVDGSIALGRFQRYRSESSR